jgi:hypothetical protein
VSISGKRAEVIVQVAALIEAWPRLALRAPSTRAVYIIPFSGGDVDLADDIATLALETDIVAGTEMSTWMDTAKDDGGPALRITCRSAVEMGMWP